MPVILDRRDFGRWLDHSTEGNGEIAGLLRPCPVDGMVAFPVSTVVNNARNDVPACVERVA
jgi:putative SOS response-associated peptidase YedK